MTEPRSPIPRSWLWLHATTNPSRVAAQLHSAPWPPSASRQHVPAHARRLPRSSQIRPAPPPLPSALDKRALPAASAWGRRMRKLKFHEKKLLKKTNFLEYKREGGRRHAALQPRRAGRLQEVTIYSLPQSTPSCSAALWTMDQFCSVLIASRFLFSLLCSCFDSVCGCAWISRLFCDGCALPGTTGSAVWRRSSSTS
jgi:hypothetical protein